MILCWSLVFLWVEVSVLLCESVWSCFLENFFGLLAWLLVRSHASKKKRTLVLLFARLCSTLRSYFFLAVFPRHRVFFWKKCVSVARASKKEVLGYKRFLRFKRKCNIIRKALCKWCSALKETIEKFEDVAELLTIQWLYKKLQTVLEQRHEWIFERFLFRGPVAPRDLCIV